MTRNPQFVAIERVLHTNIIVPCLDYVFAIKRFNLAIPVLFAVSEKSIDRILSGRIGRLR
jgi:hypothetical protein